MAIKSLLMREVIREWTEWLKWAGRITKIAILYIWGEQKNNLRLQQQKTRSGSTHVSQDQESEDTLDRQKTNVVFWQSFAKSQLMFRGI